MDRPAALAAARRRGDLTANSVRRAIATWDHRWSMMWPVAVSDDLSAPAGALADEHDLSGADAVHLATALAVGGDVILAVWDRRLHRAAMRVGLAVAPATVD